MDKNELLPLSRRRMGSVTVKLPAVPERLLEQNYGPEWRIPNPLWRFDWREAWDKFAAFRARYKVAEGGKSIS